VDLDEASTLTPIGDGRYGVDLREEFAIGGNKPNGGYLLACLGRAALAAAAEVGATQPYVVAAGIQYVRSPDLGAAVIETEVLRVGGTASQVSARVVQDGTAGVAARFTLGHLHADSAPHWGSVPPVEIAPYDDCPPMVHPQRSGRSGIEVRFDPEHRLEFSEAGPSGVGEGELRAWITFDGGRAVTPAELLYVVDSLPPATFTVLATGWVPTLDLTVYVRAVPVPGPLRVRFRAQVIQDGFADEAFDVWDAAGRLVAQSTQLTALRMPPAS
jgi:acyl-coenzyme A thioesterase PaaI-like protein